MTIRDVQHQTQKQPFEPFRVLTADGQHDDVPRPERLAFGGAGGVGDKGQRIAIGRDDDSFVTPGLPLVATIHRPIPKERASRRKAG